ncbi:MAG TPA: hypothetical protein VJT77_02060 [Burkholderiales bacterium]|nr:hypothetical protein [Burkholderiales bacterium]
MELVKKLGPYVLLEMLLPGGTLLAVGLYLYRHRKIFCNPMSIRALANRL